MACTLFARLFRWPRRGTGSTPAGVCLSLPNQASASISASLTADASPLDLDSLLLLNNLAHQGSYSLVVCSPRRTLDTASLTARYSASPGFLGVRVLNTSSTASAAAIDFATASDATMALANSPLTEAGEITFAAADEDQLSSLANDTSTRSRKRIKLQSDKADNRPTCKVCFEKLSGPHSIPCLKCNGTWCYDCLQGQFKSALGDTESFPARCCASVIHYDVVKGILPTTEYEKYKLRYEEFSIPKPIFCANPRCSTFLPPRLATPDDRKQVSCYACRKTTCAKCRELVENPDTHQCPPTNANSNMLSKYSYKRCPRCDGGVAKMFGCPHVRCQCGAHWCWDCRRPIHVCWRRPCDRSREDGHETEEDDTAEEEVSDANTEVGDNVQNTTQNVVDVPTQTVAGEQTQIPAPTESITITVTAASNDDVLQEAPATGVTPANVEVPPVNVAVDPSEGTPIVAGSGAVPTAEPLVNLDAADFDQWDNGDFDFGGEPTDEQWDTWGCIHRPQGLLPERTPEYWLPNRATQIDCLRCFEPITFREPPEPVNTTEAADDAVLRGRTRFLTWMDKGTTEPNTNREDSSPAATIVASSANEETSPPSTVPQDACPSEPKTKKKLKEKAKLFTCFKCGVVYCPKCKKEVLGEIAEQFKKQKTVTQ